MALRITSQWIDNERTRNVYKNIVFSLFIKGASIAVSFLIVPLTLAYVDKENYGIWMTISAITMWFGLIDVSFGNGIRNQLVKCLAKQDYASAKSSLSTLYFILSIAAVILSLLLYVANIFFDLSFFVNVKDEYRSTVGHVLLVVLTSFSVQIALKPINAILLADQRSSMTSWLLLTSNLIALMAIYVATKYSHGSLITLAYIQSTSPVLVYVVTSIWLFSNKYKHITPSYKYIKYELIKPLFSSGGQFMFLQIISVLMFSSGNLIVSNLINNEQVAVYSVASRYYGVIPLLYGIIITPYWSAFTESYIKRDYSWIKGTLDRLNKFALFTIVLGAFMIEFAEYIYYYWIGGQIEIPTQLSISFAAYATSYAFLSNYNYLINGIGKLKVLVYTSIIGLIIYFPLNILLVKFLNLGTSGVVIASTLWNLFLLTICIIQSRKFLSGKANGIWNR